VEDKGGMMKASFIVVWRNCVKVTTRQQRIMVVVEFIRDWKTVVVSLVCGEI
jgi:hypothetical protein